MVNFKNLLETYRNIGTKENLFSDFDRKISIVVKKNLTEFSSFYLLVKNKLPIYSEQFTSYVTYLASQGKSFFKEQINKISNLYKFYLDKFAEYRGEKIEYAAKNEQVNLLKFFLWFGQTRDIQSSINLASLEAIEKKYNKVLKILIETNQADQQARGVFLVQATIAQNAEGIKIIQKAGDGSVKAKREAIRIAKEKKFSDILAILEMNTLNK